MELQPHNQDVYDQIVTKLNSGSHSLCYIQGTGSGKSTIFHKLVTDYFMYKKILYVVPKKSISKALAGYANFKEIEERVTFVTYNSFYLRANKIKNFDVIFVDEVHHIGSAKYGEKVRKVMNELIPKGKYFIGMTATPERFCDGVDITKFFNDSVYGLSTFDYIEQGKMPSIEYYVCNSEFFDKAKEFNYKEVIDYNSSLDLLKDMIKHCYRNKWICFFSNINDLNKNLDLLKELFPQHRIVPLHSNSKLSIEEVYSLMENEDKVVIASVDMLLEGVHLKDVEGLILFRNVKSSTIFQQMLGRILSINSDNNPVVIDCTKSACQLLYKLLNKFYMTTKVIRDRENKVITAQMLNSTCVTNSNPVIKFKTLTDYTCFNVSKLLALLSFNKTVYKNMIYHNINDCCYDVGANVSEVRNYIGIHKVSPETAIDMYFNRVKKSRFKYFNLTFRTLEDACLTYNVNVDKLLEYAANHKLRLPVALDMIRGGMLGGFVLRSVFYYTISDCLYQLNISEKKMYTVMSSDACTAYEAISKLLQLKENASFFYRGAVYDCLRTCCRSYQLSHKFVKRLHRKTNKSYKDILDELLS